MVGWASPTNSFLPHQLALRPERTLWWASPTNSFSLIPRYSYILHSSFFRHSAFGKERGYVQLSTRKGDTDNWTCPLFSRRSKITSRFVARPSRLHSAGETPAPQLICGRPLSLGTRKTTSRIELGNKTRVFHDPTGRFLFLFGVKIAIFSHLAVAPASWSLLFEIPKNIIATER